MSNTRKSAESQQSIHQISCFNRKNYILMILSAGLITLGFILMTGPACTMEHFEPTVFSTIRMVIAPNICFAGYLLMIVGIMV